MRHIIIVFGDLFKSDAKYICHQCNSFTENGAHLAKAMFEKFPHADIYKNRNGKDLPIKGETPGNIIIRGDGKDKRFVINMIGQWYPGRTKYPNSKKDGSAARLRAFKECLDKIVDITDLDSIAFPWKIGCGAAGGDWMQYQRAIEEFAERVWPAVEVSIYNNG